MTTEQQSSADGTGGTAHTKGEANHTRKDIVCKQFRAFYLIEGASDCDSRWKMAAELLLRM